MTISTINITPFSQKLKTPLTKQKITTVQINLGRKCNLVCTHCHVEAGPNRTEELSPEICQQLQQLIRQFPQIETVDLTGGAPEMNYGFRPLVETAREAQKEVIVRSNLTIFFVPGFTDLPEYFAKHKIKVVASLPCYLPDNVDQQRGKGVYNQSIQALQKLNQLGYGVDSDLILDLVYNPPIPKEAKFNLTPQQMQLEEDYKQYLRNEFGIVFNHLFTITNLPIGRIKKYLQKQGMYWHYLNFLAANHNQQNVNKLMCRSQLSIDCFGNIYDCDFNQMEAVLSVSNQAEPLTVDKLLEANSLDLIETVQTADYCYGCTAGCGSSCGGSLS